ncbi:MAG: ABC transporter ATP-binding protein [Candidatus Omnitrophota bacterium]
MLKIKNVSKTFKRGNNIVAAVKGADLTISKGERVYIHGPSGAGKSTLLHIMGGLSEPTSGNMLFQERDIYALSDRKRSKIRNQHFGFVFQFYHLVSELSVLENVMLPAMIKGGKRLSDIKKEAHNLLSKMDIEKRKSHIPAEISGGEAQRTAIARALINGPEILFCDEPSGNLDSKMSEEIYNILHTISEDDQMSVIVVSHQEVKKDFFNTEYVMRDGELGEMTGGKGAGDKNVGEEITVKLV